MKSKNKILQVIISGFFLASLFLSLPGTAYAQANKPGGAGESIVNLICAPTEPGQGSGKSDLYSCINNSYKLIVVLGSLGAVFWIIVAGYLYMASDGSQESVTKAKEIMVSTVAGMFIILMTFVFLRQLNPEIVNFPAIDLQTVGNTSGLLSPYKECMLRYSTSAEDQKKYCTGLSDVTPSGGGGGKGDNSGRSCNPITNAANAGSVQQLSKTCFAKYGEAVVRQASIVASSESGGIPTLHVNAGSCPQGGNAAQATDGKSYPAWGMWQINLTVHKIAGIDCPSAWAKKNWTCSQGRPTVKDYNIYNQCVAAAQDLVKSTEVACKLYEAAGKKFNDWGNKTNEHGLRCGF